MATVANNQALEFFHLLPCVFILGWKERWVFFLYQWLIGTAQGLSVQLITRIKYTERSQIIAKCLNHSYANVCKFTLEEHLHFIVLTF